MKEQETAGLRRLLSWLGDVLHQIGGFVLHIAVFLRDLADQSLRFAEVVQAGRIPSVAGDEARQDARHVGRKPRRTLAMNQALEYRTVVDGVAQVLLNHD